MHVVCILSISCILNIAVCQEQLALRRRGKESEECLSHSPAAQERGCEGLGAEVEIVMRGREEGQNRFVSGVKPSGDDGSKVSKGPGVEGREPSDLGRIQHQGVNGHGKAALTPIEVVSTVTNAGEDAASVGDDGRGKREGVWGRGEEKRNGDVAANARETLRRLKEARAQALSLRQSLSP